MPVSKALVDCLVSNGVDTVFGIPGTQTLPLNEDIDMRDDVRYVMARHETAVSHQAWGYAETSGRTAATLVIPGPGDMNAMNGLKNALNDCTPLVHLAVETDPELRGGDAIHETPPDTYDNVVKQNVLVETPESTVAALERAIAVAETPPMGPVRVGIPKGFLKREATQAGTGMFNRTSVTGTPEHEIEEAACLLAGGNRPLIVAGGGVRSSDATDELCAVAERLDAPVVTTYKGKGVFPEDHELAAGILCGATSGALRDCIEASDVALGVGTDFDAVATQQWSFDMPDRLVHVTLHESDLGVGYDPAVGIVADAREALSTILESLPDATDAESGAERVAAVRDADWERMESLFDVNSPPLTSVSALRAVREALPREAITTVDAGGFRLWTLLTFDTYGPRRYVNPGSWATMGTGVPSAIGAKVANPDVPVVALTGDGGLMMCVHELHTAASEDLPIVVVALRNDDYAVISEDAGRNYRLDEGEYEWDTAPLDIAGMAESMGVVGVRANTPVAISEAVTDALDAEEPTVIEVPTDPREPQAHDLMPRST